MKNARLIALVIGCTLFSLASFAQSFTSFGTYTGINSDGKEIKIELNANGTASMEIDGDSQGVISFVYQPNSSNFIKFKAIPPGVNAVGETVVVPIFRGGLFEPLNATQWQLQLGEFGQPAPTQFDTNAIILDFTSN